MKIYSIYIDNFKIDGGAMFGVVPKVLWNKHYPADEDNLCTWALRSVLVDLGDRKILVDNGYGDKQDEKFFSHVYLQGGPGLEGALKNNGFTRYDITDMVLTHLHADHCGGSVQYNKDRSGFEMTFPNANYWVSRQQWDWAINPNKREKDAYFPENYIPIRESGQLKFVETDLELYPGFSIRLFNGHTQGQIIPFIRYNGRTIVFMADLMPSTAHMPLAWNMSYDVFPLETIKEKDAFLNEALENDYVLFFEHDVFNECCTVKETPKGVRVNETFTLAEYFAT
ncbi:MAG: MBL fold metallo-hydrolase [Bacteroidales bacterium]|nr:MAG: MBL fold metallo-hydrolase [Bacteroidales bacterium]